MRCTLRIARDLGTVQQWWAKSNYSSDDIPLLEQIPQGKF